MTLLHLIDAGRLPGEIIVVVMMMVMVMAVMVMTMVAMVLRVFFVSRIMAAKFALLA